MKDVDISVVIPCLNEEKTIKYCIEKAKTGIKNSGLNGEIIVSDNGSIDDSIKIASEAGATVLRKLASGNGYDDIANFHFPSEMRAVPTIALYNPITGTANGFRGDSANYTGAAINSATTRGVNIYKNSSVGATVFMAIHATATAEL